jgi:hypothetical protein
MATCLKRSEDKITGDDKTEDEEEIGKRYIIAVVTVTMSG